MISDGEYCLMRWAPAFQLTTFPSGSSMKMAYSLTAATSSRKVSSVSRRSTSAARSALMSWTWAKT